MSGLWRDHPATLRQQALFKPARKRGAKPTQAVQARIAKQAQQKRKRGKA
jgi:hypothetical protein